MSGQLTYFLLGLIGASGIFLVWKEWKRVPPNNRLFRIIASLLALAGITELLFPIHMSRNAAPGEEKAAVILTEGYQKDSLAALMQQYTGRVSILQPAYFGQARDSGFTSLHLLGYGLSAEDLIPLSTLPLEFHPPALPPGLRVVDWQRRLPSGAMLRVQGQAQVAGQAHPRALLTLMDKRIDSVELNAATGNRFELQAVPPQLGRSRFQLTLLDGNDTLEKEWIPVEITEPRPLQVLVLGGAPGFENKFLTQWLAKAGYPVAMRTQISTNKFEKTFLNLSPRPIDRLGESVLKDFDVLIADGAALSSLSAAEREIVKQQVEQKGMGLVVRADSSLAASGGWTTPFHLRSAIKRPPGLLRLQLPDTNVKVYPIFAEAIQYLSDEKGTRIGVRDSSRNIIVASTLLGSGRKIVITLPTTYPWILAGKSADYARFWAPLIEQAAKRLPNGLNWRISPAISFVNASVGIGQEWNGEAVPAAKLNEAAVSLSRQPSLPFLWQGKYWPTEPGWQAAQASQGELFWWWANGDGDWKTARYAKRLADTRRFIAQQQSTGSTPPAQPAKTVLPRIFAFLIILICCAFLWIESKIYDEGN